MQTLEVTDEQYAFIQQLRAEISEDVVGRYGFVREQDAIQFLIDNLGDEVDVELEADYDLSATDDVAESVDAAVAGKPDPNELTYDEGPVDDGVSDGTDGDVASGDTDESDAEAAEPADAGDESESESEPEPEPEPEAEAESDDDSESGDADDDDMLDEMMSLLETHDDKWEESSSADYRYSVELPDGSTEEVQTKDDVRALLFKNYR
ncbi:hypothetical protein [Halobiforma nitratireducens]|uniref:Uncharacterized protein n=1 Tax=Halobiforma nitratireducens JCM 10879 TaxID=1227454 RepID=M0MMR4_9EURY|nr:hypothetical protein [Halobiforma nitratireducens]EMA45745.1 hypothetical protein C446_02025 [Halobiforma nitratireducens JCM 10879]